MTKRNLRWILVVLSAVALGYPLVFPCQAEDKPLRAIAYDAGFDGADCSYHSITLASDGRIYFSMSGHRIDQNVHLCCYDPQPGKMVFSRAIGEGLKNEDTTKTLPQGKIHSGLMDSSSGVYAGEFAFNDGRPTVHSIGANVALLDGHAERVPFKKLWEWRNNRIVHSFWYLED